MLSIINLIKMVVPHQFKFFSTYLEYGERILEIKLVLCRVCSLRSYSFLSPSSTTLTSHLHTMVLTKSFVLFIPEYLIAVVNERYLIIANNVCPTPALEPIAKCVNENEQVRSWSKLILKFEGSSCLAIGKKAWEASTSVLLPSYTQTTWITCLTAVVYILICIDVCW